MSDAQSIQSILDEPRYSEEEAARIINPSDPPSPATMRRLTNGSPRRLGFYRIAGRKVYGKHHIEEYLASCEQSARRRAS
ncbi:MAG TPA: hypothetical protein VLN59_13030 [Burkholderiales bacterium]|nr:hypothetical protein [Burkholderiales bacterium]